MSTRSSMLLIATAALAFVVSGCGGSTSPSIANLATTTSSSAAGGPTTSGVATQSSAAPSRAQMQRDLLKYSECMRAHGVPNFPDPSPGGGFQVSADVARSSPMFQAAQTKCTKLLPIGPLAAGSTTHPTEQWLAQMRAISQCMRRHGISGFPDPTTSVPTHLPDNGEVSDIKGVILVFPNAFDLQSPAFARAAAACNYPLHNH